jgi:hypothetical protein
VGDRAERLGPVHGPHGAEIPGAPGGRAAHPIQLRQVGERNGLPDGRSGPRIAALNCCAASAGRRAWRGRRARRNERGRGPTGHSSEACHLSDHPTRGLPYSRSSERERRTDTSIICD